MECKTGVQVMPQITSAWGSNTTIKMWGVSNQWILQETVIAFIKTQREESDDDIVFVPDHPIPLAQSKHTKSKSCEKNTIV